MPFMDWVHGTLDVAGMVPVIGEVADGVNAGLYAAQGDFVNAGISLAGMIPVGGQAITGTRVAVKVGGEVLQRAEKQVLKEGGQEIAQQGGKQLEKEVASEGSEAGAKNFGSNFKKPTTRHQKAALGEKKAHEEMAKRGKRIDQGGEYKPGQNGIDGVYKNHNPPPDYTIMEAKYDTSRLGTTKDGRQMCDDWIDRRLDKAVGQVEAEKIRDSMLVGNVDRVVVNVKPDGSTVMRPVDSAGKYIK